MSQAILIGWEGYDNDYVKDSLDVHVYKCGVYNAGYFK